MKNKYLILLLCLIISLTACLSGGSETSSVDKEYNNNIQNAMENSELEILKNEITTLTQERDNYKAKVESLESEYSNYKAKMKEYEGLEKTEAEARKIQADKVVAEEETRKKTEEEEQKRQQEEKAKKGYDTGITYDQLARDPDDYMYELVKFEGKVLQVLEGKGETQLRLATSGSYDDVIYCAFNTDLTKSRILEDDYITVYGKSYGLYSYSAVMGNTVTLPMVWVEKLERIDYGDLAGGNSGGLGKNTNDTKTVTIEDFDIKHYLRGSNSYSYDYAIVTNNSDQTVRIDIEATAVDKDNNMLAIASGDVYVIGPKETVITYLTFRDLDSYDHIEYEYKIKKSSYYKPVIGNLSYELIENSKNIIISVTNNGSYAAEFVKGYILWFDAKDNLIGVTDKYIVDDNSEIKSGETEKSQFSKNSKYDHYEVYFSGRG